MDVAELIYEVGGRILEVRGYPYSVRVQKRNVYQAVAEIFGCRWEAVSQWKCRKEIPENELHRLMLIRQRLQNDVEAKDVVAEIETLRCMRNGQGALEEGGGGCREEPPSGGEGRDIREIRDPRDERELENSPINSEGDTGSERSREARSATQFVDGVPNSNGTGGGDGAASNLDEQQRLAARVVETGSPSGATPQT